MIGPVYFFFALLVMAGITYLIRLLPLLFVRKRITNKFLKSFLYYVPYVTLSVMTFPAILYSTGHIISAAIGSLVALFLAYKNKSLIVVAALAALTVLFTEGCIMILGIV